MMALEPTIVLHTLSTASAAILLVSLSIRLWKIYNSSTRGTRSWQVLSKAVLAILFSATLALSWTRVSKLDFPSRAIFVASLVCSMFAVLGLGLLPLWKRQPREDSDLDILYLAASVLCDVVYLNMPYWAAKPAITSHLLLVRCCTHSALLILECSPNFSVLSAVGERQLPEDSHNILIRVFFLWVNPILLRGYKSILINHELPPLGTDLESEFTRKAMLQAWSWRVRPETNKTLPLALVKCFSGPFLGPVLPRLFLIIFRYSQPNLIHESIRFTTAYGEGGESRYGYWLIVSAVTIYGGLAISTAVYKHRINKLKLMTRSALVGLIHHKIMESPSVAYENGEATTLINTDAENVDGIAEMAHETWAQTVEVLIGIALLANQVGWIWPLPLFLIYLCSHMSRFVAKHLQPRQKEWNQATQNRIAITTSVLSSMKTVKMLGLQDHFTCRIQELREAELWAASKLRWITVFYNASANALGIFSPAITLAIYAVISVASGSNLDTETAFTTMAILSMVTHPANMVMTIVPRIVGAFAGFERIQDFLVRPSLQDRRGTLPEISLDELTPNLESGHSTKPKPAIQIRQVNIGQNRHSLLEDINIDIPSGSLTIIAGPTGSGKSTLMRAILGEVLPSNGSISLSTRRIAYCAQKTWLPNGTIREAIYGATDISIRDREDDMWYWEVVNLCCLSKDFGSLTDGDQTYIGHKGLNLSGGQRQRVALARALFARCDILLLDDIFSGLDGETENAIFNSLFGSMGLIRRSKTTVVLVSNSSQYFRTADHIVVLGGHGIIDQGKWQDIKITAASIEKFSSGCRTRESTVISANFDKLSAQLRAKDETKTDLGRKTGDLALYGYYLGFIDFISLFFLFATTLLYGIFITFPQYWLKLWTNDDGQNNNLYVGGFLVLSFMSWISTSTQMWSVVIRIAPQSGLRIHRRLLQIVTRAPLSYFSTTDIGSILNRFSQDTQLIDKQLPSAFQAVLTQISKLVMQIILLCIVEKWLAIGLPACMLLVYVVQTFYLRTSRQLRLLELESQASVFSNFLESIEGLETIRGFGWCGSTIEQNISSVDSAQRPEFLLFCLQRWLNLVLDLLAAGIATSIVAIAVGFRGRVSGAQVGIALNIMLVANTTLLKLVGNWTTLETSLGAISRLKTLERLVLPEDSESQDLETPKNWPPHGHIQIKNITASYQSKFAALQNVTLDIPAGQKLIVCGRTGSGKSTLLLALFRILELQSGKIEIDGVDIKQVRLDWLRQRCFITMSQDPLILPNESIRFNLDSDFSVSDDNIVDSLQKSGLWSHFLLANTDIGVESGAINIPTVGGHPILDRNVAQFPELSVGQCQLFALCRSLVKASSLQNLGVKPVLVLDEITSSLDPVTESTVLHVIDEEFTAKGHTVIIVAHRIGFLEKNIRIGRDAVALMADGKLLKVFRDLTPTTFRHLRQTE